MEDFESRQQREFLRSFSRVAAFVTAWLAVGYQLGLHFPAGALVYGACAAGFFSLPWLASRWSTRASGHALATVMLLGVGFNCLLREDLPLGALMYLCVVPLATSYLSGPRASLIWSSTAALMTLLMVWRVKSGHAVAAPEFMTAEAMAQRDVFEASSVVGVLAMMTGMALSIERRRANVSAERMRLKDELDQRIAVARVGRLASGVAHEINNPLAWMTSGLSFLRSRVGDLAEGAVRDDFEQVVTELTEGTNRVAVIVGDLQAVARGDSDHSGVAELARVFRIVKSLGRSDSRSELLLVASPSPLPTVRANEGALAELLLELVLESGGAPKVELSIKQEATKLSFVLSPVTSPPLARIEAVVQPWGGTVALTGSALELTLNVAAQ